MKHYYLASPKKRKGDAITATHGLFAGRKEVASLELTDVFVRVYTIKPCKRDEVIDLLDAVKEIAENSGCRLITYYGDLDGRGEILKEYGFKESSNVPGGRWFKLVLSED
ncbi:MAG: hypothetical protein K6G24_06080 [Lachnospiraceae bacterium]|nr:hypothetical protein [Lachnospiraceae bacterium]